MVQKHWKGIRLTHEGQSGTNYLQLKQLYAFYITCSPNYHPAFFSRFWRFHIHCSLGLHKNLPRRRARTWLQRLRCSRSEMSTYGELRTQKVEISKFRKFGRLKITSRANWTRQMGSMFKLSTQSFQKTSKLSTILTLIALKSSKSKKRQMCEIGIWKMNAGLERKRNAVGSSSR
jgi:hypothetical protein